MKENAIKNKSLMAKMQDDGSAFNEEEIEDFAKIYRKFIRRNKDIGEFFIKETKDITQQLCDDFEKTILKKYSDDSLFSMAAEP